MEAITHTTTREITRGIVAIYKEYVGRGPTEGHTVIGHDVVTCVLHDSLLPAEVTLVQEGNASTVRQIRRDFQMAMKGSMTRLVEETLERKVQCLLSDHSPDPDFASEVFVLEPQGQIRASA